MTSMRPKKSGTYCRFNQCQDIYLIIFLYLDAPTVANCKQFISSRNEFIQLLLALSGFKVKFDETHAIMKDLQECDESFDMKRVLSPYKTAKLLVNTNELLALMFQTNELLSHPKCVEFLSNEVMWFLNLLDVEVEDTSQECEEALGELALSKLDKTFQNIQIALPNLKGSVSRRSWLERALIATLVSFMEKSR